MTDRVHIYSLEGSTQYDIELPLENTELSNIVTLDWDSQSDLIFWGDASKKTINSASITVRLLYALPATLV